MAEKLNDHTSRAHALLSASSSARWLACPPSALAAASYPNEETPFTREGTVAHEVAEMVTRARLAGGPPPIIKREDCEIYDEITPEMIRHAESYATYIMEQITDPNATVLLEQRLDYSPWVPDGFGTGDCLILEGDTLHVIDYKYGKGVEVSANDNPQMGLYALGAYNEYGLIYDIKKIVAHIFQPRKDNVSAVTYPVEDLLEWGEKVKKTAALAYVGAGNPAPGGHCRFCPHAGACTALAAAVRESVQRGTGAPIPCEELTPAEVAEILGQTSMIEGWVKAVKARALSDMLDGKEIPGYKLVEGKQGNRAWTDEAAVAAALKAAGYGETEYLETKLLTPAAMDKALGKKRVEELLADLIHRAPGGPAIDKATSKKKVYDRLAEAKKDFE